MKRYKRRSGDSGVVAYESGPDFIAVKFNDGTVYHYTFRKPGRKHVQAMKKYAEAGIGLSTYISQHVRENYDNKR